MLAGAGAAALGRSLSGAAFAPHDPATERAAATDAEGALATLEETARRTGRRARGRAGATAD